MLINRIIFTSHFHLMGMIIIESSGLKLRKRSPSISVETKQRETTQIVTIHFIIHNALNGISKVLSSIPKIITVFAWNVIKLRPFDRLPIPSISHQNMTTSSLVSGRTIGYQICLRSRIFSRSALCYMRAIEDYCYHISHAQPKPRQW